MISIDEIMARGAAYVMPRHRGQRPIHVSFDIDVIDPSVGLAGGYLAMVEDHLGKVPPLFRVPIVPASLGPDAALRGVLDRCPAPDEYCEWCPPPRATGPLPPPP